MIEGLSRFPRAVSKLRAQVAAGERGAGFVYLEAVAVRE
jgi:hypothetical protein